MNIKNCFIVIDGKQKVIINYDINKINYDDIKEDL